MRATLPRPHTFALVAAVPEPYVIRLTVPDTGVLYSPRMMTRLRDLSAGSLLGLTVCTACTDRLSGPEAAELVTAVEYSFSRDTGPRQLFMGVWEGDLRLRGAVSTAVLWRDGRDLTYRSLVFERVVVPPSGLDDWNCAGTRRAAYFWRDGPERDGLAFRPEGSFDQRLVPGLSGCPGENIDRPRPMLEVVTPNHQTWLPDSTEGDISPGVVIGACAFMEAESALFLREEYGITCETTRHRVRFSALVRNFASGRWPDSSRVDLPSTEIVGVRYTIHCDGTQNPFRVCTPDRRVQSP